MNDVLPINMKKNTLHLYLLRFRVYDRPWNYRWIQVCPLYASDVAEAQLQIEKIKAEISVASKVTSDDIEFVNSEVALSGFQAMLSFYQGTIEVDEH